MNATRNTMTGMLRSVGTRLASRFKSGTDSRKRSVRRAGAALSVDGLEDRKLMTGSATLNGLGQLIINGTNYHDTVVVGKSGGSVIVIEYSSDLTKKVQAFNASQVKVIGFSGQNGNDTFYNLTSIPSAAQGGAGSDLLIGGFGKNALDGGDGYDVVIGGPQNDTLYGGGGQDILGGGGGNDVLYGGSDNDILLGGSGNDSLYGDSGTDLLHGGTGGDYLNGGSSSDYLDGGSGFDTISDSSGSNLFRDDSGSSYGKYTGTGKFQAGHFWSDYVTAADVLAVRAKSYTPPPPTSSMQTELNNYLNYQFAQMNADPTNSSFWDQTIPEAGGLTLRKLSQAPNMFRSWHV